MALFADGQCNTHGSPIVRLPLNISSELLRSIVNAILLKLFADLHSLSFSTAGRMVKTGLTASVIVSQWTWAATLLQSSNVAWKFGVSAIDIPDSREP